MKRVRFWDFREFYVTVFYTLVGTNNHVLVFYPPKLLSFLKS